MIRYKIFYPFVLNPKCTMICQHWKTIIDSRYFKWTKWNLHNFLKKICIYAPNQLHLSFRKWDSFNHGMTTYEQWVWKPCPFVCLLTQQSSWYLEWPYEGCYNSKYKHAKFPFDVSVKLMNFLDITSTLELVILTISINTSIQNWTTNV